jgi:hypothetical protein
MTRTEYNSSSDDESFLKLSPSGTRRADANMESKLESLVCGDVAKELEESLNSPSAEDEFKSGMKIPESVQPNQDEFEKKIGISGASDAKITSTKQNKKSSNIKRLKKKPNVVSSRKTTETASTVEEVFFGPEVPPGMIFPDRVELSLGVRKHGDIAVCHFKEAEVKTPSNKPSESHNNQCNEKHDDEWTDIMTQKGDDEATNEATNKVTDKPAVTPSCIPGIVNNSDKDLFNACDNPTQVEKRTCVVDNPSNKIRRVIVTTDETSSSSNNVRTTQITDYFAPNPAENRPSWYPIRNPYKKTKAWYDESDPNIAHV